MFQPWALRGRQDRRRTPSCRLPSSSSCPPPSAMSLAAEKEIRQFAKEKIRDKTSQIVCKENDKRWDWRPVQGDPATDRQEVCSWRSTSWSPQPERHLNKVNRCLARYSPRATTTNRPNNRAPKKPAWPGPNWPKMPILGPIWSFWGKKSFFFTWEIISFVTHITENSPRHLVHIVFGRSLDKMCKKRQDLAKNDQKCI